MIDRPAKHDIPRLTLGVVAILAMAGAAVWVMKPFIAAIVWATMIVIATWPMLVGLQRRLGGRRGPAVAVMVVGLLAMLVVPVWIGVSAIADNADRVTAAVRGVAEHGLPPPPAWVEGIPLVGERAATAWRGLAGNPESLAARLAPHVGEVMRWAVGSAGGIGAAVVQFLLTVVISGILYVTGETAARGVRKFTRRLAGERGDNAAVLASQAIRAVALGIVVTALTQTAVSGIGLLAGGVPHAALLTAVVFVLCIAQLGPLLVMVPATIWAFSEASTTRGIVLVVFTVLAGTLDNFLRPVLIKRGADIPFLIILAGVLGGLVSFGVVGLFVGPVLLAVTWTLLESWVNELDEVAPPPPQA